LAAEAKRVPRIRRRLAVRFGSGGELSANGLTANLSARGVGISSPTIYPAGTPIAMELSLASGEQSRMTGVVIWSTRTAMALNLPGTMGVRIDTPDQVFLQLVSRLAAEREDTDPALTPVVPPRIEDDWWQDPDSEKTPRPKEPRPAPAVARVPRFFEQVPVRFGLTAQLSLRGFTENISRNGMAILGSSTLAPNDTVLFALTLPDERLCHGTGSVMWTRLGRERAPQHSMGVRITRVESNFKDLLEALARRH
jgi:hypothetical protein